jgi:hypothetical protein
VSRRAFSPTACAVPRSAFTTISLALLRYAQERSWREDNPHVERRAGEPWVALVAALRSYRSNIKSRLEHSQHGFNLHHRGSEADGRLSAWPPIRFARLHESHFIDPTQY